ncbi:MAG: tRNA (adenosine(37)-N6)-threonylcarbamoyltransferase complex ATPase subunit type 1 TsaE [Kiritimatiellae bacterium]|nr:tRNA (adenosine(37)-N6)-threonylcarbamoyltransferase complex ATPase subunit type 1 TsaE [Kiritimatiellia bacterium]
MKSSPERRTSSSPEETHAIARDLAARLGPGAVLAFHGELGAGKTCFIQGLAEGLGVTQAVNSPTFMIVNEYRGRLPLYHIDLYRIHGEEDALNLGLDEYLHGRGVTAIEWAEKVERLLPPAAVHITLEMRTVEEERIIIIGPSRAGGRP